MLDYKQKSQISQFKTIHVSLWLKVAVLVRFFQLFTPHSGCMCLSTEPKRSTKNCGGPSGPRRVFSKHNQQRLSCFECKLKGSLCCFLFMLYYIHLSVLLLLYITVGFFIQSYFRWIMSNLPEAFEIHRAGQSAGSVNGPQSVAAANLISSLRCQDELDEVSRWTGHALVLLLDEHWEPDILNLMWR